MIEAKQEPLPHSAFDYSHYIRDPAGMITERKRKDGAWICVCATTPKLWIDDVGFSNSLTVEHNTLGGGSIGHILRHTETNSSSYAQSHRWFHYDQVGSVMAESDASGALAQTHYQDAFGNTQASWSTGLWGGDKAGWHHNTKELDSSIDLVYMGSRWHNQQIGTFTSSAPLAIYREHRYGFAQDNPVLNSDPNGANPGVIILGFTLCVVDGPLPFGDAVGVPMIIGGAAAGAVGIGAGVVYKEHTKNARPSTKEGMKKVAHDKDAIGVEKKLIISVGPLALGLKVGKENGRRRIHPRREQLEYPLITTVTLLALAAKTRGLLWWVLMIL